VDLGCGYGLALLAVSLKTPGRRLFGCDLDHRRIAAARLALSDAPCTLEVSDAGATQLPPAGLVLIIDVLQYFDREAQAGLLARCGEALSPGGQLIFRVPESRAGWTTTATALLDRLIFSVGSAGKRPTHLPADVYRRWLEGLGFTVRELHHRNRLPLSHVVFVATKAEAAHA
jgi:SAM-dependent methyltransferase